MANSTAKVGFKADAYELVKALRSCFVTTDYAKAVLRPSHLLCVCPVSYMYIRRTTIWSGLQRLEV